MKKCITLYGLKEMYRRMPWILCVNIKKHRNTTAVDKARDDGMLEQLFRTHLPR